MHPWLRWFGYINHISYAFKSLMVNEVSTSSPIRERETNPRLVQFSGREFSCTTFIPQGPSYNDLDRSSRTCTAVGATSGSNLMVGDSYIGSRFQYHASHRWR